MPFPKLFVFSQDKAEAVWKHDLRHPTGPRITDIVSIREPHSEVPLGLSEHTARQLRLVFRDIPFSLTAEENLGRPANACSQDQMRRLVRFSRHVRTDAVVVVHCAAGASRSPAAALILLATLLGPGKEAEAVQKLQAVVVASLPNPRIVFLGDHILQRGGRLFQAYRDAYWTGPHPYNEWYPESRLGAP